MFEGLKVVELASVLAGPAVGMFFSELGAEVIKIENSRTNGDVTRSWKLPSEDDASNVSAYFSSVNWGKTHLFKDLSNADDHQEVIALINEADIVIANFKEGDDRKFGLDYETLKAGNSKMIYAYLKGFESIPERVAYDVVLQAEAGYMYMNGDADGLPTKMPLALMDILAAHQLKEAILVALYKREKTGKGGYVESSLERSSIAALANQASNWLMAGHIPQRMGSLHPNIAPYGEVFTCSDGKHLVLAIGSNKQFQNMCNVLDANEVSENESYADNQARVINRIAMHADLQQHISNFERDALLDQLIDSKVPAAAIRNMQEVFETPIAKELILNENVNGTPTQRVATVGFKLNLED